MTPEPGLVLCVYDGTYSVVFCQLYDSGLVLCVYVYNGTLSVVFYHYFRNSVLSAYVRVLLYTHTHTHTHM